MAQEQQLVQLNNKIDTLLRVIAYQLVAKMTLTEGAPLLKRLGFKNSEIAGIYETSQNTVAVRLAESRKKSKKPKA